MALSGRRIEAVLFDLGETLLHFGRPNKGRLIDEAIRRSYDYLKTQKQPVGPLWSYRLLSVWGIRWNIFKSWLTGSDFNSLDLLRAYGASKKMTLTEAQWEEVNWQWYKVLAKAGVVEPGTAEALEKLTAQGLKLGVLSNTFVHKSSLERHLEQEGLLKFFPVRLYSYEFPWRKPNVKIFREAARRIDVEPAKIMFVGDLIGKDVVGALAAGMTATLKNGPNNAGQKVSQGVYRIDRIAQLPELIESIERKEKS